MQNNKMQFRQKGVTTLNNVLTTKRASLLYQKIHSAIINCARELNCPTSEYLHNVSRWVHPSAITHGLDSYINTVLKDKVSEFYGEEVTLAKMNVISKSAYANHAVPCHQDISYSKEKPYEFSVWLPLQDVSVDSGVMEFLPGSHLEKIHCAVDFWQPSFIDDMFLSEKWKKNFLAIPIQTGNAIVFDSRIWHRSAVSTTEKDRFAIVSRWNSSGYQPPSNIPDIIPGSFGLWTCGKRSEELLQSGLLHFFQITVTKDLETSIALWLDKLSKKPRLPFEIDYSRVKVALNGLLILHRAYHLHNGGDAQGIVYPELWHSLLQPMTRWLTKQNQMQVMALP